MNKNVERVLADRATQPLPQTAKTRSGVEFAPHAHTWIFRDGTHKVSMNFKLLPDVCAPLLLGIKKTLIWYLENRSPGTAQSTFFLLTKLLRFLAADRKDAIQCITSEGILAFKMSSQLAEYQLAGVRGFIARWRKLGAPGVGEDVDSFLSHLNLKRFPVGVAVATLDPTKGPFTDLEFEALQSALNLAFAQNGIDAGELLLGYLLMALGARPSQFALLKCCDLIVPTTFDGDYILRVPRVKQSGYLDRDQFKARKLTNQIGAPLAAYAESIRAEFAGRLADTSQAPMFPQEGIIDCENSSGFEFHQTASRMSKQVIKLFASLRVRSERLEGQPIPANAVRFRRTFATRAAEEGWPLLVLAELMDHTDTRHVEVYAGLTTRIRATFSRKIAMDMAPLAMVFGGKIIRGEDDATCPNPRSRIIDLRIDQSGAGMGSCGSHVDCGFSRPIACYGGCHDFEPWLDGPHEAALDYLLARREHLIATADLRIAAINDRAILGCTQIILRCREISAEDGK